MLHVYMSMLSSRLTALHSRTDIEKRLVCFPIAIGCKQDCVGQRRVAVAMHVPVR